MAGVEFSKVPNNLGCSTKIAAQIFFFCFIHDDYEHFLITAHSSIEFHGFAFSHDRVVPQG